MRSTTAPVTNRLQSFLELLRQLLVESGMPLWPDERLRTAPREQVRLQLFVSSFTILFLELAFIRWIPANVRLLGYFMNFILLAVFLGIGVGILAGRRPRLWLPPFPLVFFLLAVVVATSRVELRLTSMQVLYYGGESAVTQENAFLLPLIFILVALTFVPLARSVGRLLTALPPLQAYAVDILGSLAGIAAFFLMSLLSLSPLVWFGLACAAALLVLRLRDLPVALPLLVGGVVVVYLAGAGSYWSPYYRLTVAPNENGGYVINVNNQQHQSTTPYLKKETFYFRVYDLFPKQELKRVMILGAGTGSDVEIALVNGAQQVDAVEIDPWIYRLGLTLHPDHPYADPRVKVHIEDGRTFLRNTTAQYDLIIYALPDSLTLTSAYSSLRLESFLLTSNSIAEAYRHLSPNGLVVLYNYYRQDWLIQKLAGMAQAASGMAPFVTTYGDTGRAGVIMVGPRLQALPEAVNHPYRESNLTLIEGRGWQLPVIGQGFLASTQTQDLATDDWPFVYLPKRAMPSIYLLGLGMVLLVAMLLLGLAAPQGTLRRFDWHFFFLGAAFMLLETRSLVTFSLLFGSTWMVNSLVFFAILTSVLLAIFFNARFKIRRVGPLYVLLFAILLLNFVIPQQSLLAIGAPWLRYTLASLLAFVPIFLANIVFSRSFRDTEMADIAFGSNLLGSMVGGVCEYLALINGYQSLLILVIVFYCVAFFFWQRIKPVSAAA
jgi:spermidine synthase